MTDGAAPEAPGSPPARRAASSRAFAAALVLFAATIPLSIAVAQGALAIAAAAWWLAGRPAPDRRLLAPALAYSLLTVASAAASDAPWSSLNDTKELALFAIPVLVPAARALAPGLGRVLASAFLGGAAASALWGVLAYLGSPGGLEHRARGPLGHYMTWSGVLLLAAIAAFSRLAWPGGGARGRALSAALLALLVAALAASYSRNAWLGLPAGLAAVAAVARPRALPALAALLGLAVLVAPDPMRERLASGFDVGANLDRVEMLRFGALLAARHPGLGVGPSRIDAAYERLGPGLRRQPHLHNNLVQIAAERGLPALAAWLWLMAACLLAGWRARREPAGATALGAVAGLLVAGMFEYNFGDSEVKMAFLLLVSLAPATPPAPSPA